MHLGASALTQGEGLEIYEILLCVGFVKCTKNPCYYDIHNRIFSLFYTQINLKVSLCFNPAFIL